MNGLVDFHTISEKVLLDSFGVDIKKGLSLEDVQNARKEYGSNKLEKKTSFRTLRIIIRLLVSPLSLVLVAVAILSAFLSEWVDMFVVLIVLFANVLVGSFQEGKARKVFDTLESTQKKNAVVLRDGAKLVIDAEDVVPGDVLMVEGGVSIVADVRIITSSDLSVNEAALTGEWEAVTKIPGEMEESTPLAERENMLWSGTSVVSGYGVGIVVATGKDTALGKLAEHLHDTGVETRLQKSVRHLSRVLMLGIGIVIAIITGIGVLSGQPLAEILLVGIALAVAVMPEGLPAAVTVVLAVGMEVILKKGGLVRNLLAAETLGSTTYIITDKTGTLTEGKMSLVSIYSARGLAQHDDTASFEDNKMVLQSAVLASDAFVTEGKDGLVVHGRPIEKALMSASLGAGISQEDMFAHGGARIAYMQFEAARRFGASLNEHNGGKRRVYMTGSPEALLNDAHYVMVAGTSREMDKETREKFEHKQKTESSEGHRFIGIAYAEVSDGVIPEEIKNGKMPDNLVFVGLVSFADTVREDAPAEIKRAQGAGIRVLMATGDYAETARSVSSEVGIADEDARVITGEMIEKMTDEELLKVMREEYVFARVVPEQKLRMVRTLRSAGEIVAMTGDGVNDAPALVSADIGVAIGSGTDVAKEASDIVLLKNSFATITAAISEGRRIGDNLRKIIGYLLSTSFSELFIIGGALVAGAAIPLLPTQILWANVIQEGLMSFPFAFEPAEKGSMKRRPKKPTEQLVLTPELRNLIIFTATITGTLILAIYAFLSYLGTSIEEIRTVLFIALTFDSLLYMFSFKDLHRPLWKMEIFNNLWVVAALVINVSLLALSITFPPLMNLLSLTSLSIVDITLLGILAFANLITIEVAKSFFFGSKSREAEVSVA